MLTRSKDLTPEQMRVLSWLSAPESQREPKSLDALASEVGVRPATVQRWRARKLAPLAAQEARMKLLERLPDVLEVLVEEAKEGSPEHIELFLRVATGDPDGPEARVKEERMGLQDPVQEIT